jgi:N-dimethylarginine dimethylaminohydrolase
VSAGAAAGPRFLMCPPDHFDVTYSINPWMDPGHPPDLEQARRQWEALVGELDAAGAGVELLEPAPGLPDLVFTSDAGVVDGRRFVPGRPRHPERRPEIEHAAAWFASRGFEIVDLGGGEDAFLEAGEVVPVDGTLVASHGFRSTPEGVAALAASLGREVIPVELTDDRLYHLDAVLCPLDDRRAIVYPEGLTTSSRRVVLDLVPEPLALDEAEALTFCANGVVVGRSVLLSACPARVRRTLERWGFDVRVTPVSEFLKAGGSVHCLTLRIA